MQKAPSINKNVSVAHDLETKCLKKIFDFCVENFSTQSYTKTIKYYFQMNMDTFIYFNSARKNTNGSRLAGLKSKLIANLIKQIPLLISEAG